jgi:hypothetical protein
MMHEPVATADQSATKRARRPRQPAPKRRTPLGSIRRFNDLVIQFAHDLGGVDLLTATERELLRQAAAMSLRAEQLQAAVVNGEQVDGDELIRLSGEARRILTTLRKRAPEQQRYVPLRERLAAEAAEEAA